MFAAAAAASFFVQVSFMAPNLLISNKSWKDTHNVRKKKQHTTTSQQKQ